MMWAPASVDARAPILRSRDVDGARGAHTTFLFHACPVFRRAVRQNAAEHDRPIRGTMSDSRDVALGLALIGIDVGRSARRAMLASGRLTGRVPLVGDGARRIARDLAHQGKLARERLDARSHALTVQAARALAERHAIERFAAELLAAVDVDALVTTVLEHERTKQIFERAIVSPDLERMLGQVLESRPLTGLAEQVLAGRERVARHLGESAEVLDTATDDAQSPAGDMMDGVRSRAQPTHDTAGRAVRGPTRRPGTQMG
jgi:hypothetical protein